jgi:hypothetical protein
LVKVRVEGATPKVKVIPFAEDVFSCILEVLFEFNINVYDENI